MSQFSILFVWCAILQGVSAAEWAYTGTHGWEHWAESFPACGDNHQSPINIQDGDVRLDRQLPPISYSNYDTSAGVAMALRNNGHSVAVSLSGSTPVTVSSGGLPAGVFRAFQFHFHWGNSEHLGSEHFVNGLAYPMELHVVHYNTKYASPGMAVQNPDGLAVLAFFYEVSSEDNPHYSSIIDSLVDVATPGLKVDLVSAPLNSLLPRTFTRFYRYAGSLTTPPCQESVTWTIFKDVITISQSQLSAFRRVMDAHAHPMSNNFRPVQPMNNRHVTSNFDPAMHWTYNGGIINTEQWPVYYSACKGNHQSPIAIPSRDSLFDPSLKKLNFHSYDTIPEGPFMLINNGHTANMDISAADASISGGGLPEGYQAARLHFHWGSTDQMGSEHTLDDRAYPMELHIVHFKKSLEKLPKAVYQPEGLAVLGILFELSPRDNPALNTLVSSLRAVRVPGSSVTTPPFSLTSLLPSNSTNFYRYPGSLTIPGCYETVIWTVFSDTIKISSSQLSAFRLLRSADKDEHGQIFSLVNNHRPVQPLNNRVVTRNFIDVHSPEHGRSTRPVVFDHILSPEHSRVTRPAVLDRIHSILAARIIQAKREEEAEEV